MPRQLIQLNIFVSGPADAEAEKSALRLMIPELSRVLEKTHGVSLALISWPELIHSGVGAALKRTRTRLSSVLGELVAEFAFAVQEGDRILGMIPDKPDEASQQRPVVLPALLINPIP